MPERKARLVDEAHKAQLAPKARKARLVQYPQREALRAACC